MRSIAEVATGEEVIRRLKRSLRISWREYVALVAYRDGKSPFAVLVAIILSQNTNDKNSIKAYRELARSLGLKPETLANADPNIIAKAIKSAGMYKQKAETIVRLARAVISWGGEEYLLREDPEVLRRSLLNVKGVGPKTVDVFLTLVRRYDGVFAVDTHAARIARRWKLVDAKAGYDDIAKAYLSFFGYKNSEEAHRLLIALGRRYCRARNPLCGECPVNDICPSARLHS